jgi:hypothetical protein
MVRKKTYKDKHGIVRIYNINDKTKCTHENKILYAERDGFKYFWCSLCGNLIREPLQEQKGKPFTFKFLHR